MSFSFAGYPVYRISIVYSSGLKRLPLIYLSRVVDCYHLMTCLILCYHDLLLRNWLEEVNPLHKEPV